MLEGFFRGEQTFLKIIAIILVAICYSANALAEWTEWLAGSEVSYTFQDNINHAMFDSAEESDQGWNAILSVGRAYQLANNTRFFATAFIDTTVHHDFANLNQLNAGVSLAVRHKFGLGPYQPWIRAVVNSGYIFSRSRIREGYQAIAGIDVGKALHERFDVTLSYRYDYRNSKSARKVGANKLINASIKPGKSSDVFDIEGHSVGIQFNALVTQQWALLFAYNYRVGDVVSSNEPGLVPKINSIVDAIVTEDALPGWAYRADGETHRYSVDANYAFLKGHAAFNLGYEYIESYANSFAYKNNLFRVNINYRF